MSSQGSSGDPGNVQRIQTAHVAEIFSGSGNLSAALREVGLLTLEYDLNISKEHDMHNPRKMEKIRDTSKRFPAGLPDVTAKQLQQLRVANRIVDNTVAIADALIEAGKVVSIENPSASLFLALFISDRLFRLPVFADFLTRRNMINVTLDFC
ncbi:hypothetical protein AK812_SmicGene48999, partial [Symbiodinium microadriaticum]